MMLYLLKEFIISPKPWEDHALFYVGKIAPNSAKIIARSHADADNIVSAIDDEATARVMSLILGIPIAINRTKVFLGKGDKAIVLQMRQHFPEDKVIESLEELNKIGYDLYIIQRTE
jgi:hypothetical protein